MNRGESDPVFYSLPGDLLEPGLSTSDGQDIVEILSRTSRDIHVEVYTPSDDPDEDAANRCAPESRIYGRAGMVELAAFHNSPRDLSSHPRAVRR